MSERTKPVTLSELDLLFHRLDCTMTLKDDPETAYAMFYGKNGSLYGVMHGDLKELLKIGLRIVVNVMQDAEVDDGEIPDRIRFLLKYALEKDRDHHDQASG